MKRIAGIVIQHYDGMTKALLLADFPKYLNKILVLFFHSKTLLCQQRYRAFLHLVHPPPAVLTEAFANPVSYPRLNHKKWASILRVSAQFNINFRSVIEYSHLSS